MTEIVTINGTDYDTYATVVQADAYLQANFLADAWFMLTSNQKSQLLVTGVRLFERVCWLGEKTDPAQPLAWPRKNTGIPGVEDNIVPNDIIYGSIELALAISEDASVINSPTPGVQDIQTLSAGSVSMTWFRAAEGILGEQRFPQVVQELVGKYLCGSKGALGFIKSYGTDGQTVMDKDFGLNEGW